MDNSEKKHGVVEHPIVSPDIADEVADGIYANVNAVVFSPAEFVFDFGRVVPGRANFKVMARVIMAPLNAKQLLMNLSEQVRRYEQQFGEVKMPARPATGVPPGFKQ